MTGSERLATRIRLVHRWTSIVFVVVGVATSVVAVVVAVRGRLPRRGAFGGLGVTLGLTGLALSLTGYVLPWDQLALRGVTVGSSPRGVILRAA